MRAEYADIKAVGNGSGAEGRQEGRGRAASVSATVQAWCSARAHLGGEAGPSCAAGQGTAKGVQRKVTGSEGENEGRVEAKWT
jgi:hypothetical protein